MRERRRFALLFTCVLPTAAASASGAGCSGVQRLDRSSVPTLTVEALRAGQGNPKRFARVFGKRGVVVKVRAGDEVRVRLASQLGFATLRAGDNRLRFDRDVWIYLARRKALVSPDGQRWVRLGDWRAMKRVFGIRRGSVQVGFGVKRGQGPFVNLAVHTQTDP